MRLEDARGGELAEFVADHVLGDVDGDEDLAVMHAERVPDEIGRDGRAAGPGLDGFLGAGLDRLLDFLEQVVVNEEAFFDGACHGAKGAGLLLTTRLAAVVVEDDHAGREFRTATGGETLGELAPRGDELLTATATLGLALAATVGVVDRVHGDAADMRALAQPAAAAGLAERLLIVVTVAHRADGGAAGRMHEAEFARGHLELGLAILDRDQFKRRTRRAGNLGAATRDEFHRVHERGRRDELEREVVPHEKVVGRGLVGGDDHGADLEAFRGQDVALLTGRVGDQGEIRRAIRIILDGLHFRRQVEQVALEINDAVELLVPTAAVARGHAAIDVAATGLVLRLGEGAFRALLRQRGLLVQRREPAGRREGAEGMDGHGGFLRVVGRER